MVQVNKGVVLQSIKHATSSAFAAIKGLTLRVCHPLSKTEQLSGLLSFLGVEINLNFAVSVCGCCEFNTP